jgi:hypothetical protein
MPRHKAEETIDLQVLEKLGNIHCTQPEAAAVLGIGLSTLEAVLQRSPEARDAWERGLLMGNASLRRKQFELALDGDRTMLVWCGKNTLGQTDKQTIEHLTTEQVLVRLMDEPDFEDTVKGIMAKNKEKE